MRFLSATYEDASYYPGLYVPNAAIADNTLAPVISDATQIPDDDEIGIKDDILGWSFDSDGNSTDVVLDEAQTMASTRPVITVSPGFTDTAPTFDGSIVDGPEDSGCSLFSATNCRINNKFESDGESEYVLQIGVFKDPSQPGQTYRFNFSGNGLGGESDEKKLADIKDAKVGQDIPLNTKAYKYTGSFCRNNLTIMNTYERDWAVTKKLLGRLFKPDGSVGHTLEGRMTFKDEWFHIDPNINTNLNANAVRNWDGVPITPITAFNSLASPSRGYLKVKRDP